jgi:hypothetical protein
MQIQQHAKKTVKQPRAKALRQRALEESIILLRTAASVTTLQTRLRTNLRLAR